MRQITLFDQVDDSESNGNAWISSCGRYRYTLTRGCSRPSLASPARHMLFVMLNPSTADGVSDDPTIRRITGFAKSWGYASFSVVNLFAWRATDPAELPWRTGEAVGPDNDTHIVHQAGLAELIVCAWGAYNPAVFRASVVMKLLRATRVPIKCFGRTKSGAPKHPLYLAANTQLEDFL